MRWYNIVLVLFAYGVLSWILLKLSGETALLQNGDFFYWMVVTASTVGYGDLSPETTAGKYVVSLFIIPFGLSIFALIVGRVASWVGDQWRKGVRGMKDLEVENHILVIGWNGNRTLQLIRLLRREQEAVDEHQTIVLCVRQDIENPLPGKIEFVKVDSFNKDDDMNRACIDTAKVIIVDNPEDDLTMTTALYASQKAPNSHLLAYFQDESLAKLLRQHCPNVECMPSVAVEMLAKSAFDPGSSMLHHDLLSVDDEGQAQFSADVPTLSSQLNVEQVFTQLKKVHSATLIGLASSGNRNQIHLNPELDMTISSGDKIYYIAPTRIKSIEWEQFNV